MEVSAAKSILRALDLDENYIEVVSCPTCARTKIDLISIANAVNDAVEGINKNLKVAVMAALSTAPEKPKTRI